ncbi:hypothetical protein [Bradyrhizobium sp. 87]|uniref:hypothetical protein n=1 Tax=Bradyrhizobium sp. 87 TaxID=2782682 RepID=UPI001FF87E04|nr:hypothetical protein [Bradyrhizobium sp. 87]MCK1430883.1 hypothetical protein [Bradyrhizobium sp. 87]
MSSTRLNNILQFGSRHPQADNRDFLLLQLPETDAAEYSIDDAMVRKSIDKDVFHFCAHSFFPGLFVGLIGTIGAKGKTGTRLTYDASELSPSPTKCGDLYAQVDSTFSRVVPDHGTLPAFDPCNAATSQLTSQRDVGRGRFDRPAGSRGAKKQYNHRTEIVRLPSGSIAQIPSFESLDLSQARFHRALVFALPVSLLLWSLIGLSVWLILCAIR